MSTTAPPEGNRPRIHPLIMARRMRILAAKPHLSAEMRERGLKLANTFEKLHALRQKRAREKQV